MDVQAELISRLVSFFLQRKYERGERVPSERELALRFKVGRGNVREALSSLEALRIVERRAKSGIYMSREAASVEALVFFAQLGIPLDPLEIQHSVEIRRIHELAAVELACERATAENFASMRHILDSAEAKIKRAESIDVEDADFHLEIVNATQNHVFHRIVKIFYLMTERQRALYFRDPERCRASHGEHLRIYKALLKRDRLTVVKLIGKHLQGVDSYWQSLSGTRSLPVNRALA